MNNDLISKAELFNKLAVIKAPPEANEYKGEVYSAIQAMETADDGWIPIEEREPDTADHVLVTARWDDLDYEVFELDYGVTKALANRQGYIQQDFCKNLIEHIIAWHHKPEPYKGV